MDKSDNPKENTVVLINEISKLLQDIEKKVAVHNTKAKECEELKVLKSKCCDKNPIVSISGFHGIRHLVERKVLIDSQTISMLVSLLPSISQYGALVSTIGDILLMDLKLQTSKTGDYKSPYSLQIHHPFIIIMKYNLEKSWFEVYHFVLQLMQANEDIKVEHKLKFLRPIFRQIFWSSSWRGCQFQLKLFSGLMLESHKKQIRDFTLEVLLWQELDIHYCLFLQEFFIHALKKDSDDLKTIIAAMTPALALATKWLILNGYNPGCWLKLLKISVESDAASSGSTVLFILTDVITKTPSVYINPLVDVCKSIILSTCCSKYVVHKFVAITLNLFVSPSFLVNPLYKTLEGILDFIIGRGNDWNDQTFRLSENPYYRVFGNSKTEVKSAVDLILVSNSWSGGEKTILSWLENFNESNEQEMQFQFHSFLLGMVLCEEAKVVTLCLDILFRLIEKHKDISFSVLCLLFYKLGRETDPRMQKIYLFSLPRLSVKKENIPLIVRIVESLKRGRASIMTPLIIQLYLSLWKLDNRTYSYLHRMLHDETSGEFAWELNVSKAIALKEISRLAPHLHAKDLVGVLSRILNECSGTVSGLPSAIAIEAVTDLCNAYVIDVAGTWNAIQPKLRLDKRPKVISSLCRFFGNVPSLNPGHTNEELTRDIVSMLWNYTFFKDPEVVRTAFRALSNFPIENLPLDLLPEVYRTGIKWPKGLDGNSKTPEDILNLPYVPAQCWEMFLKKIEEEVLQDGGHLISTLLERELISMPRGLFYLPPEKPEPLSYSYLPSRSVCRCLAELLQKHSREVPLTGTAYLKEAIRVLSREYSRTLPPLDWSFLEIFMCLGWEFSSLCLRLLAKQATVSASSKTILEKYFTAVEWNSVEPKEILFTYDLLPLLCKGVSYNILQNALEETIRVCLEESLRKNTADFEKLLESVTGALRAKSVSPGHKKLIAKQLEKVLALIPTESDVMKKYALCATEFPVQSIEELTSIKEIGDVDVHWLRHAITIRSAIAMREDIKNPLMWLNEFTEAVAHFRKEQNRVLNTVWFIIRSRRSCDHRSWVQELIWRIQTSITSSNTHEENKVTALFLIDVFVSVVIILSGYDHLFTDVNDFIGNEWKKLDLFPQALRFLFSFPDWNDMLSKVGLWLQKVLKWKHLPKDKVNVFAQALLALKEVGYLMDENESSCLFNMYSLPLNYYSGQ